MGSEDKTYILKQPVTLHEAANSGLTKDRFIEVNSDWVDTTRKQIEDLIHKVFMHGYEYGVRTEGVEEDPTFDYERLKQTFVDRVFSLITGETK